MQIFDKISQMFGYSNPVPPTFNPEPDQAWWTQCGSPDATNVQDRIEVFATDGSRYLGPMLKDGGEGAIYPLVDDPSKLVKLYHSDICGRSERVQRLKEKINRMIGIDQLRDHRRFAWPQIEVQNKNNQWVGFAMRRCEGYDLHSFGLPRLFLERFHGWNRRDLAVLALNIVHGTSFLHNSGVMIGDINPGNFMVHPSEPKVFFIDCDSYQVNHNGRIYPCEGKMDLFTAPEFQDVDLLHTPRSVEQELFGIAVILFHVLMLGMHPYSRVMGEDPVRNLRSGACALGKGSGCQLPKGPWYNLWSHLSFRVKNAFIKAFRDGHSNPRQRPTLDEWSEVLQAYIAEMDQGKHVIDLIPGSSKQPTYKGKKIKTFEK